MNFFRLRINVLKKRIIKYKKVEENNDDNEVEEEIMMII